MTLFFVIYSFVAVGVVMESGSLWRGMLWLPLLLIGFGKELGR